MKFDILRSIFGYDSFRPLQEACIQSVLDKKDTVLIMPTGGGKSLCYQIPALIFPGLTIVVSPLISLMKDQVSQLKALGIEAEVLNSSLTFEDYESNVAKVRSGKTKLLFCAPETLFKEDILTMLASCHVECITIDEAHCISEWGHDFRPEYRRIKDLRGHFPKAVFLAVTATATPRVRQDIITNLALKHPRELVASFNRDNLFYEVIPKGRSTNQTLEYIQKFKNQSGIIYCFSRKQVDTLTKDINRAGFKALPYHAGLADNVRNKNQELFIKDDVPIMVATIAFGMGINKPNVRFVVHHDLPKNIESYYQETGRAGRDGLPSRCLLLFSAGDSAKIKYFIDLKTDRAQKQVAQSHLNTMLAYAESLQCRRIPLNTYFGENYAIENCGQCVTCTKPHKATVNLTGPAVRFLQCVSETDERFGALHIINVLRGSQAEKILSNNHNKCKTFGSGRDWSVLQWQNLVHQALAQNFLSKSDEYGVLSLTDKGYELLSRQRVFHGYLLEEEAVPAKSPKTKSDEAFETTLFDKLRSKRKELADKNGVPPYIIFSDKSLVDMCQKRPKTKAEFSKIFGVGEQKLQKFSAAFIEVINS